MRILERMLIKWALKKTSKLGVLSYARLSKYGIEDIIRDGQGFTHIVLEQAIAKCEGKGSE